MDGDIGLDRDTAPSASGGTLAWAVRTALVAAFLGLAVTHHLARASAPVVEGASGPASRTAGLGPIDPETTGSIAAGARSMRLDPCAVGPGPRAPNR